MLIVQIIFKQTQIVNYLSSVCVIWVIWMFLEMNITFFFECVKPDIVTLCQQCIPRYYLQSPSMFKLIQLLKSSDDVDLIIGKRISISLKNANCIVALHCI